ncbi:MAG TPA: UTP--glucose-1-phosphate uridylyltransferase [Actinoplanes sp.]|nr:UTP--glucose-1-phosphate uridylyltransferase [Actinoplanes sp.]
MLKDHRLMTIQAADTGDCRYPRHLGIFHHGRADMDSPAYVLATLMKAEEDGAHPAELAALRRRLQQLDEPRAGLLAGEALEPLTDVAELVELPEPSTEQAREVLDRLVVVKLNGGLGTSMGLTGPKSLLEVKDGMSFLDVIATQVLAERERYGVRLPLLLMNSAATRGPSLAALDRYEGLRGQQVPRDFLQGREPKLRAGDRFPVEWPADPELEWCPPGHGDLYTALAASGTLNTLLDAGLRWCFVSNSDNLGATVDVRLAAWIAAERIPFAMEAVRGTPADRKGGHLALHQGQVVLRETAQVPEGDASFTDVGRWQFYNTNNLWIDLRALRELQEADPAAPALPLIVNRKTVDPKDPSSTPVIQLETAMGAAIGSIPGARPVLVPRTRFAPVKTTDDLLVVRSDAYELTGDGRMIPTFDGPGPVVALDPERFRLMPDFEKRFPAGPPSLRRSTGLRVKGDVTFGANIVVEGDVQLTGPLLVPDGEGLRG